MNLKIDYHGCACMLVWEKERRDLGQRDRRLEESGHLGVRIRGCHGSRLGSLTGCDGSWTPDWTKIVR